MALTAHAKNSPQFLDRGEAFVGVWVGGDRKTAVSPKQKLLKNRLMKNFHNVNKDTDKQTKTSKR